MALKIRDKKALENYILKKQNEIEKALIYNLEYLIEDAINHAKVNKGYADRTSNLKSSIGGCVIKDNKIVSYKGFVNEGQATDGAQTGLSFMQSLVSEVKKGYVALLVAGMEYATYVENYHGLNVLKKTEMYVAVEIPKMMDKLKSFIENN